MKFWESILATFWHPNSDFWGLQEGIQDRADYEGVWASILERFSKAWERQKLGFRMGGFYFFGLPIVNIRTSQKAAKAKMILAR